MCVPALFGELCIDRCNRQDFDGRGGGLEGDRCAAVSSGEGRVYENRCGSCTETGEGVELVLQGAGSLCIGVPVDDLNLVPFSGLFYRVVVQPGVI